MKKILVVIPSLKMGGAERVISSLIEHLNDKVQWTLLLFDSKDRHFHPPVKNVINLNVPSRQSYILKSFNLLLRMVKLMFVLSWNQHDKILTFSQSALYPTFLACMLTGKLKRLLVSVRSNPESYSWFEQTVQKFMYRRCHELIVNSRGMKDFLMKNWQIPDEKIKIIYNPIILDPPPPADPSEVMATPEDGNFILAVGRLSPEKGFEQLIFNFGKYNLRKKTKLLILGDGLLRPRLEQKIHEYGLESSVFLLGKKRNLTQYYRNARLLVFSSTTEGWPNVINESLVNGCPVVGFDCNYGPREIIADNINGYLINLGDYESLLQRCEDIIDNPALQKRLSDNCLPHVKKFDIQNISLEWLRLFSQPAV